jgi:hypothetical protein
MRITAIADRPKPDATAKIVSEDEGNGSGIRVVATAA